MNAERLLAHYERIADAPDTIARVRRFILDLAVRGKLVPQDPKDEPASELLKRIAAEKARLVKASEIRKEKPLPEIEPDEMPYDAPLGWEWARIRKVTTDRGQMVPDRNFTYVDVTAINKEAARIADAKLTSAIEAPSRARKIVRKGDLLYSCVRPYLLNIAIVESDIAPPPIASTAFAVLNGFGLVLPKYQWIVLRSPFMVTCVEEKMRGQAYPAINDSDFALLPFPLPPLAEQHRIVAKVDELMALCDRLEAARAKREAARDRLTAASLARLNAPDPDIFHDDARFALDALPALTTRPDQNKQLRQTILNLAVRGKLVPQDPNDEPASELLKRIKRQRQSMIGDGGIRRRVPARQDEAYTPHDLPKGWTTEALGNLVDPACPISYGVLVPGPDVTDGVLFVRAQDLCTSNHPPQPSKSISPEVERAYARTRLRGGEILICVVGSIGKLGTVPPAWSGANIARAISRVAVVDEIASDFVLLVLRSDPVQAFFAGATRTLAQPTLNIGLLEKLPVPLPPLAEQRRIVAKVDELMGLCDRLEASLTTGEDTRRRLLDALLHEALMPGEGLVTEQLERVAAHG